MNASRVTMALAGLTLGASQLSRRQEAAESAEAGDTTLRAICILDSRTAQKATGIVRFEQESAFARTKIRGDFTGLTPNHLHGFHIHTFGDLSNGCLTAGPHWNPHGHTHAGPDDEARHVGDLGNVQSDGEGKGVYETTDGLVTLFGAHSVIGRSCVLHEKTDDLGRGGNAESLKTGNAGARIACGVIGRSA